MSAPVPSLDRPSWLALMKASEALISEPQLDAILQSVVEQAAVVLDSQGASVLLFEESRSELVFRAATGPKSDLLVGERFDAGLGIAGQVTRTRRPVRVDDVSQNRNFFQGVDAKTHLQTRCLIAAPMINADTVVGVVEVINPKHQDHYGNRDVELLQLFTNLAAAAVRNGQAYDRVERTNLALRRSIANPRIVGRSETIRAAVELCGRVAPTTATVLIGGETGTGKEVFARTIHDTSDRRDKPFIAISCAAMPETLLDSELFGHEKGAFTGADGQKLGRFELADTGTLFLDELGEIPMALQVKLLRVLQEREFVRVGGTTTIPCDVRVVAATNRDLKQQIEEGTFRAELFYRLNVFPIQLPPLRDRTDDVPLLVDHFLEQIVPSLGIAAPSVGDEALAAMCRYDWPGNIRELRNVIERGALLARDGLITVRQLPPEIAGPQAEPSGIGADRGSAEKPGDTQNVSKLASQERVLIVKALGDAEWNKSAAARTLGISRDQLRYRIKKHGLRPPVAG